MPKMIIEYPDDMNPVLALTYVLRVVSQGRISEAAGIKHFCWATELGNPEAPNGSRMVYTRRKRSSTSADSFVVGDDT